MARFQVGEAFLKVTASVEGIHRTVEAEVRRIRDVVLNVTPDMGRFREKVEAGTRGVRGVEVDVVANTERARVQVGAFAQQVKARLDAATAALGDIRIDGDAGPIERKIFVVRQRLATLQNQRIGLDIDADGATREIAAIHAELTSLGRRSPNIQVRVDTAAAVAELAVLRKALGDTERSGGGLRGVVGSLVTGLGSLVGIGNRVGSSLTSLGSSISGVGGTAAEAGSAFQGMSLRAVGLVAQLGGLVVVLPLIAGGIGVAVAGIGQLGGAVVALGSGLVPLVGLLGTLPGLVGTVGVAVGALTIAFGDAGLKKEVEGLKKSFEPLVSDIRDQLRPALTELVDSVESLVPLFRRVAPVVTSALSDVSKQFSGLFRSSSFQRDLETLLRAAGDNIRGLGTAAKTAFGALTSFAVAAQPAVNSLIGLINDGASSFAKWVEEGRRTGEIARFLQQGVDVLRQLMEVLGNTTGLFKDLWDSANNTGAFQAVLGSINDGITRMRDYVSDADGAWSRLMNRVKDVSDDIIGLIGDITDAFVQIGADIDLKPAIDGIRGMIEGLIPFFKEVGQALGDSIAAVGPVFGDLFKDWGPSAANSIRGVTVMLLELTQIADELATYVRAAGKAFTGDFAGAGQLIDEMNGRLEKSDSAIQRLQSQMEGATPAAQGLTDAITGVPTLHETEFIADTTGALGPIEQARAGIHSVPPTWLTRFAGDIANIAGSAQQATGLISAVTYNHMTTFSGNPGGLTGAVAQARDGIASVPETWLTSFTGDIINIAGSVGQAAAGINSVPGSHGTTFTGDPGPVVGASGQATGSINSVPGSHFTAILGDAGNAILAAQSAISSINSVPPNKTTAIQAQDQSTGVIRGIINWLNSIPRTITTVVRTITGGAGGGIMTPTVVAMASGGVLPMAEGDALDRMRPMSGRTARIVGPQTYRLIGDRMVDDEAFIPINDSAWSTAILAETARRKRFELVPMARGGFSRDWRDERAWEWLRGLLEGTRDWPNRGGPPAGGGTAAGFPRGSYADFTRLAGFGGGTARIRSAAHHVDRRILPTQPASNASIGGASQSVTIGRNSLLGQILTEVLRHECRSSGGGNVQLWLGAS